MESLAMGVPVITSNARGCRDVVRHGVDGVILEEVSQDHVAAAMERFVTDAEYRARLSENALAGRDRFNRKNYVNVQTEHYSLHGLGGANGVEMERPTEHTI
jgi:glycosyltransferase involved in cell wall biosynthesis